MIEGARKVGRPKEKNVKSERLEVRLFPKDKESLIKTSEKFNVPISELIHLFAQVCDRYLIDNKNK